MTTIRFESGLREIGGTFVVIETGSAKCMFDFGYVNAHLVDGKRRVRAHRRTHDLVKTGILPAENGLYDEETATALHLLPYDPKGADKNAFFVISHMHIDHMGGLDSLHPDLPVYMSADSLTLYMSLAHNGTDPDLEITYHPASYGMGPYETLVVGDMEVTCVPVDHDVIGACGYLIRTKDGVIAYTGDFRLHGFHPEVTRAFADSCRGADVLICESTMAGFDDFDPGMLLTPKEHVRTEYTLIDEVCAIAKEEKGLLIANFYDRNVERVRALADRLSASGRILVTDERCASHLRAFFPERTLHVFLETAFSDRVRRDAHTVIVTKEELLKDPARYVLQLTYRDADMLCDLKDAVSTYLHFDGVPIADYDPSYQVLLALLKQFGIPYRMLSVGGHAHPFELKKMVEAVKPKLYVPIHGFHPERLAHLDGMQCVLPGKGQVISLPYEGESI